MMVLRKAAVSDQPVIWQILRDAIEQRRKEGSQQWQQGYPNEQTVVEDLTNDYAYVLVEDDTIVAYAALIFGIEPAYNEIDGKWLTDGDYVAIHRVATASAVKGKGVATTLLLQIEDLCRKNNVSSIKLDTNFDNVPMLRILDKLNYTYCGEVFFIGAPRKAYEKVLSPA